MTGFEPALRQASLRGAAGKTAEQGRITYHLYRDHRLAAEADGEGRITAHYVYLNGQPVAKIEMTQNTTIAHRLWQAVRTLGGLWPRQEADAEDSRAAVYAIHADHLGTPQAVTDSAQRVVWRADTDAFGSMLRRPWPSAEPGVR